MPTPLNTIACISALAVLLAQAPASEASVATAAHAAEADSSAGDAQDLAGSAGQRARPGALIARERRYRRQETPDAQRADDAGVPVDGFPAERDFIQDARPEVRLAADEHDAAVLFQREFRLVEKLRRLYRWQYYNALALQELDDLQGPRHGRIGAPARVELPRRSEPLPPRSACEDREVRSPVLREASGSERAHEPAPAPAPEHDHLAVHRAAAAAGAGAVPGRDADARERRVDKGRWWRSMEDRRERLLRDQAVIQQRIAEVLARLEEVHQREAKLGLPSLYQQPIPPPADAPNRHRYGDREAMAARLASDSAMLWRMPAPTFPTAGDAESREIAAGHRTWDRR